MRQTAKELEELEREAEVAQQKAVKELERRWEERQGRDKGRIEKVGVTPKACSDLLTRLTFFWGNKYGL
jgi:hypothetical protein